MKTLASLTLICLAIFINFSCDHKQYAGTISYSGNSPFHKLILTTDDGTQFELVGNLTKDLISHQYTRIVIVGKEIAPFKGPGFPAQIEIIKVISMSK
ncbi:MAG: hypothetical protein N2316_13250 [Spirochaetes bacterium]|nr:hypothetical protein [Spirochaetota bacterium]